MHTAWREAGACAGLVAAGHANAGTSPHTDTKGPNKAKGLHVACGVSLGYAPDPMLALLPAAREEGTGIGASWTDR